MTEQTTSTRRRFGFAALFAAALVGLVGGGLATTAVGQNVVAGGFRHFGGGHGGGPIDAAHAKEHAERMAGHLSWAIDATPEQRAQLTRIATGMVNDLLPVHQKMHAAKARIVALLRQPKTDRAALEALRAEHVAMADDVSKRIAAGLADAADVLTPQQRTKLAEHWAF